MPPSAEGWPLPVLRRLNCKSSPMGYKSLKFQTPKTGRPLGGQMNGGRLSVRRFEPSMG